MIVLVDIECIWLFMNFWLPGNFFEEPCPWVEVFIAEYAEAKRIRTIQKQNIISNRFAFLNKHRILPQGSNFNFNFVEIILWVLSVETSRFSLYAQARKFNQPQSQNYNWNRLAKKYSFKQD